MAGARVGCGRVPGLRPPWAGLAEGREWDLLWRARPRSEIHQGAEFGVLCPVYFSFIIVYVRVSWEV